MEKKSSSCSFFFSGDNTHLFAAPNVVIDVPFSSSVIAIAKSNTNASPQTVETQEVDLRAHILRNPPSPPLASTSPSSGVLTSSSESLNATITNNNIADDDQFQGMPTLSFSVQTVFVLSEGIEDIIIALAELTVEASIMFFSQVDSSKFIRDPIYMDNVLPRDSIEQLLSVRMGKTKETRLLLTARDRDVHIGCRIRTDVVVMK